MGNTKFAMLFTFPVETFSRQLDMSLEFRDMGWRNNTALNIHQCEGINNLGSGCGWRKEVQEMSPDTLTYRGRKTEDKQQRSMTRTS